MSDLDDHVVNIFPEGEAVFPHVDWESSPITVWHRERPFKAGPEYIVFKLPAGKHWESILNPSVPHPGRYLVTEVVRELDPVVRPDAERLMVKILFSQMPLSNRGREAMR